MNDNNFFENMISKSNGKLDRKTLENAAKSGDTSTLVNSLSQEDKQKLNTEVESAKEVYKNSDDVEKLKSALESLTKVSNEIFTKLYQNANPNGANGAGDGTSTDPNNFTDFKTE